MSEADLLPTILWLFCAIGAAATFAWTRESKCIPFFSQQYPMWKVLAGGPSTWAAIAVLGLWKK